MPAPVIVATSLACPVGLAPAPACAAMRAGLSWFEELDYLGDGGQPIIGSPLVRIPRTRSIRERLQQLLGYTLGRIRDDPLLGRLGAVALLMAFVEQPRPGADDLLARELFSSACAMLGKRVATSLSSLDYGGAPAGFRALERARLLLAEGRVSACIVCGLDSWLDARSLLWLGERAPVRTVARPGLAPGEAGAALLLTTAGAAPARPRLRGLGFAVEPSAVDLRQPLRGEGLRAAVVAALSGHDDGAALGLHEIDLRLSDDAGTHAGAKEQMLLLARSLRSPVEDQPLWLPAEFIGHVGAAAGLVQMIWAVEARTRGYLPGPRVLCTTGSLGRERAAAVVELTTAEGRWS